MQIFDWSANQTFINVAVAIFVGAIFVVVFVLLLRALDWVYKCYATPSVHALRNALLPYIYHGILAGEKAVLWGLDVLEQDITSTNKKSVADSIYDLLPDVVMIGVWPVPVSKIKIWITREMFESWVAETYNQADAFIRKNEQYLIDQINILVPDEENAESEQQ